MVVDPNLAPDNDAVAWGLPHHYPAKGSHIDTTNIREQITSTVFQNWTSNHSFIRKAVRDQDHPEEVIDIICISWRNWTTYRYEVVLRKWKNFCRQTDVNPLVTNVKTQCRYSVTCASWSAFSSALTIPAYKRMSNHTLLSWYITGIYNKHPLLPKYANIPVGMDASQMHL